MVHRTPSWDTLIIAISRASVFTFHNYLLKKTNNVCRHNFFRWMINLYLKYFNRDKICVTRWNFGLLTMVLGHIWQVSCQIVINTFATSVVCVTYTTILIQSPMSHMCDQFFYFYCKNNQTLFRIWRICLRCILRIFEK